MDQKGKESLRRIGIAVAIIFGVLWIGAVLLFDLAKGTWIAGVLAGVILGVFLSTFTITWLSIFVHELGHVVMALILGLTIYRVVVFNKTLFLRAPEMVLPGKFGGYILAFKENPSRMDLVLYIAGGPLFSLAFAGLVIAFAGTVPTSFMLGFPNLLLWLLGVAGLIMGFVNLIPTAAAQSDGSVLLTLCRTPEKMIGIHNAQCAMIRIANLRPRDYPVLEIDTMSFAFPKHYRPLVLFWKALDQENVIAAKAEISLAYQHVKEANAKDVHAANSCFEMAMFAARFMDDKVLSDEAFQLGMKIDPEGGNKAGAEMGREYMYGSRARAEELASAALQKFKATKPGQPMLDHVTDWYSRIVPEMDATTTETLETSI